MTAFTDHPMYREGMAHGAEAATLARALEAGLSPEQWERVRAYAGATTIAVLELTLAYMESERARVS
jgi:hypothetical protein